MTRLATPLRCSWVAIHIATLVPMSLAQTLPSTQPSGAIVEVTLEDPLTPDSRSYLDLDYGRTYPRGEMLPDLNASRQFVREHGIDLMCDTRQPANGLVVFDLAVQASVASIGSPPTYESIAPELKKLNLSDFDFLGINNSGAKAFAFRTSEGNVGFLEIGAMNASPGKLRFDRTNIRSSIFSSTLTYSRPSEC